MTVDAKHDFTAIGQLAGRLRVIVRAIEQAAAELGIEPALRLNLVLHFDGDQVERLAAHFREAHDAT
jgi:hypothetical protein